MTRTHSMAMVLGRGLALLAVLLYALLPAGGIVKMTGPCGKALCNCPPAVSYVVDSPSGRRCVNCQPAPAQLHLVPLQGTAGSPTAPVPGPALRLLLPELVLPAVLNWSPTAMATCQPAPRWQPWAVSETAYDVPTPPPRA